MEQSKSVQQTAQQFINLDDLKDNLPSSIESEMYKQRRLDMCDRIFESIVYDLKLLIKSFDSESTSQEMLIKELERIINNLRLFSSKGEVRTLIARASAVILDSVANDIINEKESSKNEFETIGPFEKVSNSANSDDEETGKVD